MQILLTLNVHLTNQKVTKMTSNVKETSKEAFRADKMCGQSIREEILLYALSHSTFTAKMAAEELGIATATLSGVIRPMVKANDLMRSENKYPCESTGNNAFYLGLPTGRIAAGVRVSSDKNKS